MYQEQIQAASINQIDQIQVDMQANQMPNQQPIHREQSVRLKSFSTSASIKGDQSFTKSKSKFLSSKQDLQAQPTSSKQLKVSLNTGKNKPQIIENRLQSNSSNLTQKKTAQQQSVNNGPPRDQSHKQNDLRKQNGSLIAAVSSTAPKQKSHQPLIISKNSKNQRKSYIQQNMMEEKRRNQQKQLKEQNLRHKNNAQEQLIVQSESKQVQQIQNPQQNQNQVSKQLKIVNLQGLDTQNNPQSTQNGPNLSISVRYNEQVSQKFDQQHCLNDAQLRGSNTSKFVRNPLHFEATDEMIPKKHHPFGGKVPLSPTIQTKIEKEFGSCNRSQASRQQRSSQVQASSQHTVNQSKPSIQMQRQKFSYEALTPKNDQNKNKKYNQPSQISDKSSIGRAQLQIPNQISQNNLKIRNQQTKSSSYFGSREEMESRIVHLEQTVSNLTSQVNFLTNTVQHLIEKLSFKEDQEDKQCVNREPFNQNRLTLKEIPARSPNLTNEASLIQLMAGVQTCSPIAAQNVTKQFFPPYSSNNTTHQQIQDQIIGISDQNHQDEDDIVEQESDFDEDQIFKDLNNQRTIETPLDKLIIHDQHQDENYKQINQENAQIWQRQQRLVTHDIDNQKQPLISTTPGKNLRNIQNQQRSASKPKFIEHVTEMHSHRSNKSTNLQLNPQSPLQSQIVNISYDVLFAGSRGSDENIVETQRNSNIEMRHEVDSKNCLRPRSRKPTAVSPLLYNTHCGLLNNAEKSKLQQVNDQTNFIGNFEEQKGDKIQEGGNICVNLEEVIDSAIVSRRGSGINQRNRTNSMHVSKDNSLLCDLNQQLLGPDHSFRTNVIALNNINQNNQQNLQLSSSKVQQIEGDKGKMQDQSRYEQMKNNSKYEQINQKAAINQLFLQLDTDHDIPNDEADERPGNTADFLNRQQGVKSPGALRNFNNNGFKKPNSRSVSHALDHGNLSQMLFLENSEADSVVETARERQKPQASIVGSRQNSMSRIKSTERSPRGQAILAVKNVAHTSSIKHGFKMDTSFEMRQNELMAQKITASQKYKIDRNGFELRDLNHLVQQNKCICALKKQQMFKQAPKVFPNERISQSQRIVDKQRTLNDKMDETTLKDGVTEVTENQLTNASPIKDEDLQILNSNSQDQRPTSFSQVVNPEIKQQKIQYSKVGQPVTNDIIPRESNQSAVSSALHYSEGVLESIADEEIPQKVIENRQSANPIYLQPQSNNLSSSSKSANITPQQNSRQQQAFSSVVDQTSKNDSSGVNLRNDRGQSELRLTETDWSTPVAPTTHRKKQPIKTQQFTLGIGIGTGSNSTSMQQRLTLEGQQGVMNDTNSIQNNTVNKSFTNSDGRPCGEFCKHLSGEEQKRIVRNLLQLQNKKDLVSPRKKQDLQTEKKQTWWLEDQERNLKSSQGKPGEQRFLVSSVWWQKWCDFTNFNVLDIDNPNSTVKERIKKERQKSMSDSRDFGLFKNEKSRDYKEELSDLALNFYIGQQKNSVTSKYLSERGNNQRKIGHEEFLAQKNKNEQKKVQAPKDQQSSKISNQRYQSNDREALNRSDFYQEMMSLKRIKSQTRQPEQDIHASLKSESEQNTSGIGQNLRTIEINDPLSRPVQAQATLTTALEDNPVVRQIPSVKNSGATMRTSNTLNLYQRPGPIENQSLLQERNSMLLKGDLIEHHDFVALAGPIWKRLFAWYSADWSIMRMLREDSSHKGVLLDLYPLSLNGATGQNGTNHSGSTGSAERRKNHLFDSQKSDSEGEGDSNDDIDHGNEYEIATMKQKRRVDKRKDLADRVGLELENDADRLSDGEGEEDQTDDLDESYVEEDDKSFISLDNMNILLGKEALGQNKILNGQDHLIKAQTKTNNKQFTSQKIGQS